MTLLTIAEIETCYADGRGMEEFARRIEARVREKLERDRSTICVHRLPGSVYFHDPSASPCPKKEEENR